MNPHGQTTYLTSPRSIAAEIEQCNSVPRSEETKEYWNLAGIEADRSDRSRAWSRLTKLLKTFQVWRKNPPGLLLNLQDFPVTLHSVHSDLIIFFVEAHKAAECYWHLYECECLTMPAAQILFVLLRNANTQKCFTILCLSFPELRPWTSKYCRKQTRWIHGQSAPQLFATWLSLALFKWRRTQITLWCCISRIFQGKNL